MPKFSRLFLFPDVNVWLALTYQGHIHHFPAKVWFDSIGEDARMFFCRFSQLSLLRLLTTEAAMCRAEVMSQTEAWRLYDRWLEDPRVAMAEEPAGLETAFRSLSLSLHPSPKTWADCYLAAFASVSGFKLVTFDQALQKRAKESILLQ